MAEKATLYLENNKGMILDFTRSPQACDVYDFDGNLISGGGGGGNELLKTVIEIKNSRNSTYTMTWPVTFNGYCIEENNQLFTEYDSDNSIFIYPYDLSNPLTVEPGNTLIINCYYLALPGEAPFSGIYTTLDSSDASAYVLTNVQFIAEYKVFAVMDVTESSKIYLELT